MPTTEKGPFYISGVVATIHIEVSGGDPFLKEDIVYRAALNVQSDLRGAIESQVRTTLGEEFYLEYFDIRPGSAHLFMTIGTTAFLIYEGFSRYKNFVESLTLVTSQIKESTRRILRGTPNLNVRGNWTPSPSVAAVGATLAAKVPLNLNPLLVGYLILSHAALLGTFIWLLIQHSK